LRFVVGYNLNTSSLESPLVRQCLRRLAAQLGDRAFWDLHVVGQAVLRHRRCRD
jgi:hypothetical protein